MDALRDLEWVAGARAPSSVHSELDIYDGPIWTKEVSEFPWSYDAAETCHFLEGDVVVTPDGGEPVNVGKGDLVTFPQGMDCTWNVRQPVRKHYRIG